MDENRSVLIVDPSEETREVLRSALAGRGLRILSASAAAAGLALAREHCPDLIVLDLECDDDGQRASGGFAEQSREHATPLVLLGSVRRSGQMLPRGEFIAKPYHYAPLIRKIEALLAARRAQLSEWGRASRPPRELQSHASNQEAGGTPAPTGRPGVPPSLFVIRGNDQGVRFELAADVLGLGRDSSNAIQLHDTEVSRHHAEIRRDDKKYTLADLGSSNGTFVNGKRVTPARAGQRRPAAGRRHADALHRPGRETAARTWPRRSTSSRAAEAGRPVADRPLGDPGGREPASSTSEADVPQNSVAGPGAAATCRSCIARRWPSATRSTSTSCCSGSWS